METSPSIVEATLASSDVSSEPTATIDQSPCRAALLEHVQIANNSTQDDSSIDTAVNLDGFTTQFLSSQPLYALSARSNGSPTESARSIAPTEGMCRMSSYKEGQYQLSLSGVALPGGAGEAGIYLKAKNGLKTLIAKINIDANGNGQTTFSLVRPISDFSMLMIGPIEGGSDRRQAVEWFDDLFTDLRGSAFHLRSRHNLILNDLKARSIPRGIDRAFSLS